MCWTPIENELGVCCVCVCHKSMHNSSGLVQASQSHAKDERASLMRHRAGKGWLAWPCLIMSPHNVRPGTRAIGPRTVSDSDHFTPVFRFILPAIEQHDLFYTGSVCTKERCLPKPPEIGIPCALLVGINCAMAIFLVNSRTTWHLACTGHQSTAHLIITDCTSGGKSVFLLDVGRTGMQQHRKAYACTRAVHIAHAKRRVTQVKCQLLY